MSDGQAPVPRTSYLRDRGASAPPEIDFHRVASILQRRGLPMLLGLGCVMGAVALLTYLSKKTYESAAMFLVEKENPRAELPALAVLERVGRGSQIETEMKLIQSRNVVEPVVAELALHVVAVEGGLEKRPSDV